jgi:hypothetical protein
MKEMFVYVAQIEAQAGVQQVVVAVEKPDYDAAFLKVKELGKIVAGPNPQGKVWV